MADNTQGATVTNGSGDRARLPAQPKSEGTAWDAAVGTGPRSAGSAAAAGGGVAAMQGVGDKDLSQAAYERQPRNAKKHKKRSRARQETDYKSDAKFAAAQGKSVDKPEEAPFNVFKDMSFEEKNYPQRKVQDFCREDYSQTYLDNDFNRRDKPHLPEIPIYSEMHGRVATNEARCPYSHTKDVGKTDDVQCTGFYDDSRFTEGNMKTPKYKSPKKTDLIPFSEIFEGAPLKEMHLPPVQVTDNKSDFTYFSEVQETSALPGVSHPSLVAKDTTSEGDFAYFPNISDSANLLDSKYPARNAKGAIKTEHSTFSGVNKNPIFTNTSTPFVNYMDKNKADLAVSEIQESNIFTDTSYPSVMDEGELVQPEIHKNPLLAAENFPSVTDKDAKTADLTLFPEIHQSQSVAEANLPVTIAKHTTKADMTHFSGLHEGQILTDYMYPSVQPTDAKKTDSANFPDFHKRQSISKVNFPVINPVVANKQDLTNFPEMYNIPIVPDSGFSPVQEFTKFTKFSQIHESPILSDISYSQLTADPANKKELMQFSVGNEGADWTKGSYPGVESKKCKNKADLTYFSKCQDSGGFEGTNLPVVENKDIGKIDDNCLNAIDVTIGPTHEFSMKESAAFAGVVDSVVKETHKATSQFGDKADLALFLETSNIPITSETKVPEVSSAHIIKAGESAFTKGIEIPDFKSAQEQSIAESYDELSSPKVTEQPLDTDVAVPVQGKGKTDITHKAKRKKDQTLTELSSPTNSSRNSKADQSHADVIHGSEVTAGDRDENKKNKTDFCEIQDILSVKETTYTYTKPADKTNILKLHDDSGLETSAQVKDIKKKPENTSFNIHDDTCSAAKAGNDAKNIIKIDVAHKTAGLNMSRLEKTSFMAAQAADVSKVEIKQASECKDISTSEASSVSAQTIHSFDAEPTKFADAIHEADPEAIVEKDAVNPALGLDAHLAKEDPSLEMNAAGQSVVAPVTGTTKDSAWHALEERERAPPPAQLLVSSCSLGPEDRTLSGDSIPNPVPETDQELNCVITAKIEEISAQIVEKAKAGAVAFLVGEGQKQTETASAHRVAEADHQPPSAGSVSPPAAKASSAASRDKSKKQTPKDKNSHSANNTFKVVTCSTEGREDASVTANMSLNGKQSIEAPSSAMDGQEDTRFDGPYGVASGQKMSTDAKRCSEQADAPSRLIEPVDFTKGHTSPSVSGKDKSRDAQFSEIDSSLSNARPDESKQFAPERSSTPQQLTSTSTSEIPPIPATRDVHALQLRRECFQGADEASKSSASPRMLMGGKAKPSPHTEGRTGCKTTAPGDVAKMPDVIPDGHTDDNSCTHSIADDVIHKGQQAALMKEAHHSFDASSFWPNDIAEPWEEKRHEQGHHDHFCNMTAQLKMETISEDDFSGGKSDKTDVGKYSADAQNLTAGCTDTGFGNVSMNETSAKKSAFTRANTMPHFYGSEPSAEKAGTGGSVARSENQSLTSSLGKPQMGDGQKLGRQMSEQCFGQKLDSYYKDCAKPPDFDSKPFVLADYKRKMDAGEGSRMNTDPLHELLTGGLGISSEPGTDNSSSAPQEGNKEARSGESISFVQETTVNTRSPKHLETTYMPTGFVCAEQKKSPSILDSEENIAQMAALQQCIGKNALHSPGKANIHEKDSRKSVESSVCRGSAEETSVESEKKQDKSEMKVGKAGNEQTLRGDSETSLHTKKDDAPADGAVRSMHSYLLEDKSQPIIPIVSEYAVASKSSISQLKSDEYAPKAVDSESDVSSEDELQCNVGKQPGAVLSEGFLSTEVKANAKKSPAYHSLSRLSPLETEILSEMQDDEGSNDQFSGARNKVTSEGAQGKVAFNTEKKSQRKNDGSSEFEFQHIAQDEGSSLPFVFPAKGQMHNVEYLELNSAALKPIAGSAYLKEDDSRMPEKSVPLSKNLKDSHPTGESVSFSKKQMPGKDTISADENKEGAGDFADRGGPNNIFSSPLMKSDLPVLNYRDDDYHPAGVLFENVTSGKPRAADKPGKIKYSQSVDVNTALCRNDRSFEGGEESYLFPCGPSKTHLSVVGELDKTSHVARTSPSSTDQVTDSKDVLADSSTDATNISSALGITKFGSGVNVPNKISGQVNADKSPKHARVETTSRTSHADNIHPFESKEQHQERENKEACRSSQESVVGKNTAEHEKAGDSQRVHGEFDGDQVEKMSLEIVQDKSTADETIPLQSTGEPDSHVDTSGTAPATGARDAGGKMAEEPLGGEERKEADDKASCVVHEEESLKSPKAGANKATCSDSGKVQADALHERIPEEGKHLVKADTDGRGEKVSTKKEQLPVIGKNALNESQQKSEVDQKASRGGVQEGGMEMVPDRERRNSKPLEKRSYTSTPEKDKQEKKRRKVQSKAGDGKSVEVSPRKEASSSPIKKPKLPVPKSQALPMAVKCKTPPAPSKQVSSRPDRSAKIAMQTSHISAPISTGSAQVRPAVRKEQSAAEARAAVSAKHAGEQKTRLGMTPALSSTKTASKPARPSAPASEKHPAPATSGSALRSSAPASARSTLAVKQDVAKLTGTLRAKPSIPAATEKSPRPAAATAAGPVAAAVSVTAKALIPAAASPTRPTCTGKKGSGTTPVTTPAAAGAVGRPPGSARTSMAPRAPGAPGASRSSATSASGGRGAGATPGGASRSVPTTPGEKKASRTLMTPKSPMGTAPNPNLKAVRSKIGSTDNIKHQPAGGKIQIVTKKLDFSHVTSKCGSMANVKHIPGGGNVQIVSKKVDVRHVASKCGSKDNITHKPGGGNIQIVSKKLDFSEKAQSKVGSLDNADHVPGGGNVKIESQKLSFRETAKSRTNYGNSSHSPTTSGGPSGRMSKVSSTGSLSQDASPEPCDAQEQQNHQQSQQQQQLSTEITEALAGQGL
ncbi:unnamed protein product [Lampetra planeri]